LLAVLVLLAALARFVPVIELLEELRAWGETLGALWPFLFVGAYVLLALLMVPGAILTMLAGAFFGIVQGTVLVSVGATIVAMIAFVFARRMGQKDVEALLQKHRRARALQAAVRRSGWRAVLLLRLSPVVPFSLSNYLYGLTGVPLGSYVLATWGRDATGRAALCLAGSPRLLERQRRCRAPLDRVAPPDRRACRDGARHRPSRAPCQARGVTRRRCGIGPRADG
jgi:uncharacterized membrane protein YdjX (TVP38/TMEM64 family)